MEENIQEIGTSFAVIAESKLELIKMVSKKLNQTRDTDSAVATIIEISG